MIPKMNAKFKHDEKCIAGKKKLRNGYYFCRVVNIVFMQRRQLKNSLRYSKFDILRGRV